ncbi:hypothetical protein BgAZ_500590 [Babesia gibsoni]|uniref:Uncharacterized protein n=1 Tax=Babesia gibsoni TaxID=33632 RepID=A0AAD8LHL8_BABGI|nr:hypothetical protein BgAZ_500590 [Babesia gibsoni]
MTHIHVVSVYVLCVLYALSKPSWAVHQHRYKAHDQDTPPPIPHRTVTVDEDELPSTHHVENIESLVDKDEEREANTQRMKEYYSSDHVLPADEIDTDTSSNHLKLLDDVKTSENDEESGKDGGSGTEGEAVKDNEAESKDDDDHESPVDKMARREAIEDIHKTADEMKSAAQKMHKMGDEQEKEAKTAKEAVATSTATSVPSEGAGNIIITNKTFEGKKDDKEVEDPIQALRKATMNLYERAHHKGLPIDEPGELSTPEHIYQALNKLEFVIDNFRQAQLESPNPDLNIREDPDMESNDSEEPSDEEMRFTQTGGKAKARSNGGHTEADEMDDADDDDGMDDDADDDADDDSGDADDDENQDKMKSKAAEPQKKEQKMNAEEAVKLLGSTVTDLVDVLNQVLTNNTGIKNLLVHHRDMVDHVK